jgi:hypothetical protein
MPQTPHRIPTREPIFEKPWTGLDWSLAPEGFNWVAQDADGKWFWYCNPPLCGMDGGVWRSNSRHQRYAGTGLSAPNWWQTLASRPG